jgi:uncharacterized protein (TIGR03067 family)
MAGTSVATVLTHLRRLTAARELSPCADAALLERFVTGSDEAAFTALVERHGPMVLGVCRRVLHDLHDAEDACQAAFLILARKAASVRRAGALGSWLHAVAFRVACRLRAGRARRRDAEEPLNDAPAPAEPTWREAQADARRGVTAAPREMAGAAGALLPGRQNARRGGEGAGLERRHLARPAGPRPGAVARPYGPARGKSFGSARRRYYAGRVGLMCRYNGARRPRAGPRRSGPELVQLVEEVMRNMYSSRYRTAVALALAVLVSVGVGALALHGLAGEPSPLSTPSVPAAKKGRQEGRPAQKSADGTAKLLGTWLPLASRDVGEGFQQYKVEITKDRITFYDKGDRRVFRYAADPSAQPAALDLTSADDGTNIPAIYVADGDYLQICFDGWDGQRRPGAFATVREHGGQTLLLLKREGSRTATAATDRVRASLVAIGMAMHYYEADRRSLPPAARYDQQGNALWSWRATLLPWLKQDNLFQLVRLDEPWDSEGNKTVAGIILRVYATVEAQGTQAQFRVFVGPGAAFDKQKERRLEELTAGGRNPILVVEAAESVPWMKPAELPYAPDRPLPRLGGVVVDGFHALFADGSVRFLSSKLDEKSLRRLIAPAP